MSLDKNSWRTNFSRILVGIPFTCIVAADFSYSYLIFTKYVSLYFQEWCQIFWGVFVQCLVINASKNKFKKWCQPSQENTQRNGVKCCRTILAANLGHYITFNFATFDLFDIKFICFASKANFCSIWHWIESTPIQKYLNFLIFIGLFIFCLWSGITHMIYFEFNT